MYGINLLREMTVFPDKNLIIYSKMSRRSNDQKRGVRVIYKKTS